MVLYMIFFSYWPKESCTRSIIIDLDSFGKRIVRSRNIDRLNGVWSVDTKIRVGWEFTTFRLRIPPYQENGFLSYLPKMVSGKYSLRESTLAGKHCLS
jgi:hypothetical protein